MFAHNNPEMEWCWKVAFFCVDGSHPDSWQQLDNMWKTRKWQNVTSVFPCSFNSETKSLLKSASADGSVCVSVCVFPSFPSYFCWRQINQIASHRYGNHACQSKKDQKEIGLWETKQLSDAWLVNNQELVCSERCDLLSDVGIDWW